MTRGMCVPPCWNTEHTKDAGIDPMHSLASRSLYATFGCFHKAGIETQAMAFSLGVRIWDSGPEEKDTVALKKCLAGTFASGFCQTVVCHHRTHIQEISPRTEHYGPRLWKRPKRSEPKSRRPHHWCHRQDCELPNSNFQKINSRSLPEPLGICCVGGANSTGFSLLWVESVGSWS